VAAEGVSGPVRDTLAGLPGLQALLRRPVPDVLYHYTGPEGAIGIIRSRHVWATHIAYLNDSREYTFAVDTAVRVIRQRRETATSDERDALDDLLTRMPAWMDPLSYVFSLSEEDDDLSQWRGYAPAGSGYALGFRGSAVRDFAAGAWWRVFPCIYTESEQVHLITELVTSWLDKRTAAERRASDSAFAVIQHDIDFFGPFSVLAAAIKHPKFKAENEWRGVVIYTRPEDRCFRPGRSMIVPFVNVPIAPKPPEVVTDLFPRIVVGPTPHPELARRALTDLCSACGLHVRHVVQSGVPYRSW
jgi:hypothetical protein